MSLKTDLHFNVPFRTSLDNSRSEDLGTVGGTKWSITCKWKKERKHRFTTKNAYQDYVSTLRSVEIYRTSCTREMEIVVSLEIREYTAVPRFSTNIIWRSLFKAILEDGQTTVPVMLNSGPELPDTFNIQGSIKTYEASNSTVISKKEASGNSSSHPQLSDDLARLLNTQDLFCDATLKCGTVEISVHKCILSVRSPVFAAMFRNQMKEGRSGDVDIDDIEPTALWALLKYVYSGKTDDLTASLAGDLLFAADKYQLEELKQICIDKLKSNLEVNNIFRILVLGDLHDQSLKTHAIEFVCKCNKFSALEETEEWKLFKKENPGLSIEVLTSVVKYLQAKGSSNRDATSRAIRIKDDPDNWNEFD